VIFCRQKILIVAVSEGFVDVDDLRRVYEGFKGRDKAREEEQLVNV
jgi:hypothetical protein